jgi:hypothetical protein
MRDTSCFHLQNAVEDSRPVQTTLLGQLSASRHSELWASVVEKLGKILRTPLGYVMKMLVL